MEIYSGDCDNLVALECNDDDGTGNHSKITLTGRTPGETLKVRVWEFGNNSEGFFTICAFDPSIVALEDGLEEESVKIYPNPTTGPVHFSWTMAQTPASVTVFDLSGRKVLETLVEDGDGILDLGQMTNGAYLVRVMVERRPLLKRSFGIEKTIEYSNLELFLKEVAASVYKASISL